MTHPRVLITRPLVAPALQAFKAQPWDLTVCDRVTRAELLVAAKEYDAIVTMFSDRCDADFFAAAAGGPLKIVANHAVGYENLDSVAASAARIWLSNTPDVLTQATAELAWALVFALARRLGEGERLVRSGQWGGWEPQQLLGMSLAGKTVGILGAGRIGQYFAHMGQGFGVRFRYHNRNPQPAFEQTSGAEYRSLEHLLQEADILSIHLPGGVHTHHLLNRERLALMKSTALLINTGRGTIIEEQALADALRQGHLAGAALDVYEHEPLVNPDLITLENAVLVPHLGSATVETRTAMALKCLRNIQAALSGQQPPDAVNDPAINAAAISHDTGEMLY